MFISNPFAELSADISPIIMQAYISVMFLCVVAGTLFDIVHKGSAKYFFDNWRNAGKKGNRDVGGGEMAALAVKTVAVDVITSAEFCNPKRRIAHLLTMYGFIIYVLITACLVFGHPTAVADTPVILPLLWNLGLIMVMAGGYWFWFFIRVDVVSEGNHSLRLMRADLFIVSLILSATFGFLWGIAQSAGSSAVSFIFLGLYIIATTVLFGSVPWSKFSHMFYKPAAAFQKNVEQANGFRSNLPAPADKSANLGSPVKQPGNY